MVLVSPPNVGRGICTHFPNLRVLIENENEKPESSHCSELPLFSSKQIQISTLNLASEWTASERKPSRSTTEIEREEIMGDSVFLAQREMKIRE